MTGIISISGFNKFSISNLQFSLNDALIQFTNSLKIGTLKIHCKLMLEN